MLVEIAERFTRNSVYCFICGINVVIDRACPKSPSPLDCETAHSVLLYDRILRRLVILSGKLQVLVVIRTRELVVGRVRVYCCEFWSPLLGLWASCG